MEQQKKNLVVKPNDKNVLQYKRNAIINIWDGYCSNVSNSKRQKLLRLFSSTAKKKFEDTKIIGETLKQGADKVENEPKIENKAQNQKKGGLNSFLYESEKNAPEQMFINFIVSLMINEIDIEKAENVYKPIKFDNLNQVTNVTQGKLPNTRRFNELTTFLSNDPYLFMLFEQELEALFGGIDEVQKVLVKDGSKNSPLTELDVLQNLYITAKNNITNDLSNVGKSQLMKYLMEEQNNIIMSINNYSNHFDKLNDEIVKFNSKCLFMMQCTKDQKVIGMLQEVLESVKSHMKLPTSFKEDIEQQISLYYKTIEGLKNSDSINSVYILGIKLLELNQELCKENEKKTPLLELLTPVEINAYRSNLGELITKLNSKITDKTLDFKSITECKNTDNLNNKDIENLKSYIKELREYLDNYEKFIFLERTKVMGLDEAEAKKVKQ